MSHDNTEALPPLPETLTELMRHVRRLMAHVDDWQRWYGSADVLLRHQLPLPPAGTVRVMEDLSAAIGRASAALTAAPSAQPRLTVRVQSFPESNGKRNWTALLVRVNPWDGLIGNCGGITIARGELWNRVAYEAERAKLLIGERDSEPDVLDYGDDITTPDQWAGEVRGGRPVRERKAAPSAQAEPVAYVDHADGRVIWKGKRLPGGALLYGASPAAQAEPQWPGEKETSPGIFAPVSVVNNLCLADECQQPNPCDPGKCALGPSKHGAKKP